MPCTSYRAPSANRGFSNPSSVSCSSTLCRRQQPLVVVVCIFHDKLFVQKDAAVRSSNNNSASYLYYKHATQLGRANIARGAWLSGTALASNGSTESHIVLGGGNPKREWLGRQGGGQVRRRLPTPMPASSS